jgi:protein-S-isoprenylcysteine O-methyltransferase Ste14
MGGERPFFFAVVSAVLLSAGGSVSLAAAAGLSNGRSSHFRTKGLFSLSRNPMVLGFHLSAAGVLAILPTWFTIACFLLYVVHMHLRIRIEEKHLFQKYSVLYCMYARKVGRYVKWL